MVKSILVDFDVVAWFELASMPFAWVVSWGGMLHAFGSEVGQKVIHPEAGNEMITEGLKLIRPSPFFKRGKVIGGTFPLLLILFGRFFTL